MGGLETSNCHIEETICDIIIILHNVLNVLKNGGGWRVLIPHGWGVDGVLIHSISMSSSIGEPLVQF